MTRIRALLRRLRSRTGDDSGQVTAFVAILALALPSAAEFAAAYSFETMPPRGQVHPFSALNQANARKREYEEAFRRARHEIRTTNKAILNLADQAIVAAPLCKGPLKSVRNLAQALLELAPP